MMIRCKGSTARILGLVLLGLTLQGCTLQRGGPFSNPPATFEESDLVGVWEAEYAGLDRLTIREDGTFKQVYREGDYVYETPWNE